MRDLGVTESYKLKKQVVVSASEAAEMILRVDDILKCAPRRREGHQWKELIRPEGKIGLGRKDWTKSNWMVQNDLM